MTHLRGAWNARSYRGHRRLDPAKVLGLAVHYNGPPVKVTDQYNPVKFLRGVQNFHMDSRGWSDIAYNYAVDANGGVWELRGVDYESAANGNADTNDKWVAVFAVLGEGQAPTVAMLNGIRQVAALVQARYPRATRIIGHRDIRQTSCPGEALYRHVRAGTFTPTRRARPPQQQEDDPMVMFANEAEFAAAVRQAVAGIEVGRQTTGGKPLTWGVTQQRMYNSVAELLVAVGDLAKLVVKEGTNIEERRALADDIVKRVNAVTKL